MPTISIRGNEMPASPIRKLAPLADAAKQKGIHVYHLNIGQPDLPTPRAALDAIRNIDRSVLEYSPSKNLPAPLMQKTSLLMVWSRNSWAALPSEWNWSL